MERKAAKVKAAANNNFFIIKAFEEMVKLFDEFNKLTSYDQEEINISSFFIHHPISSDFIPTAFNHRPGRHVPSLYPYSTSPSSVEHQYIAINYIIKNNYYFNRNIFGYLIFLLYLCNTK